MTCCSVFHEQLLVVTSATSVEHRCLCVFPAVIIHAGDLLNTLRRGNLPLRKRQLRSVCLDIPLSPATLVLHLKFDAYLTSQFEKEEMHSVCEARTLSLLFPGVSVPCGKAHAFDMRT